MSILRANLVSNIAGKIILSLLTFVFVPYYLKILGAEAYGLVGFFTVLQAIFMLADGGLSSAYAREVARVSTAPARSKHLLDLTITLERLLLVIGTIISIIILLLSQTVAQRWLQSNHLSIETKTSCVMLMALIIGMQIPFLIYQGGLSGLQAHLRLNALQVAVALLRGVGAVVIMTWISPNVAWFFVWQAIASAIQLVGGRLLVINSIDSQADLKGEYRFDLMKPLWGFSLGVFGTTITGIVLMQLDKLVLSKVLSLEMFGYYSLAGVLASTPLMIGLPINASVYPRLAQLVTAKDTDNLRLLYHSSCQAISVAVIPLGLTIAAFSNEVMYLWTGSQLTANNTAAIVSFLSVGYTLMALMLIPYSLQLAHSWTRLGFYLNLLTIPIVVPLIVLLVKHFGAPGGAMVLILIYALQIFIMIHLMHKRLICHEKWKWYINDVGKPILTALLVIVLCRLAIPGGLSKYGLLLSLFTTWLATVCATALSEPLIRERLTYKRVINV